VTAFAASWAALWAGAAFLSGTALGYRLRRPAAVETCGDPCTTPGHGHRLLPECERAAGHDGDHVGMDHQADARGPIAVVWPQEVRA